MMNNLNLRPSGLGNGPPRHYPPRPNYVLPTSLPSQRPVDQRQWDAAHARLAVAAATQQFYVAPASASVSQQLASATSASATVMPSQSSSKPKYKKRFKKYNSFNVFFMLERQLLLNSRGGGINAIENPMNTSKSPLVEHKALNLPPLCRRYSHLPLTKSWLLELTQHHHKKRKHEKSHGLIPFKELAQMVAKNYREIDDDTQSFVNEVAQRLAWHVDEIEAADNQRWEEQARRNLERQEQAMGSMGVGMIRLAEHKRRKISPVVSVDKAKMAAVGDKPGLLTRDEATTVQQLSLMGVGIEITGNSSPSGIHHPSSPHSFNAGSQLNRPPSTSKPERSQVSEESPPSVYPSCTTARPSDFRSHPTDLSDYELGRLQIELAGTMNARQNVEKKITFLKDEITMHLTARRHQNQRQTALYHNISCLLAGSSTKQLGSTLRHAATSLTPLPASARASVHLKDNEEPRTLAPEPKPPAGNAPTLQKIEHMLKDDLALKEQLALRHNVPPAAFEAFCRSVGGVPPPSVEGNSVAFGPVTVVDNHKYKEEEPPPEKRKCLTAETLDALLAAKKHTNSEKKASEKEPSAYSQSGSDTVRFDTATSNTTESEASSCSSRGNGKTAMQKPNGYSYYVERGDYAQEHLISPPALSSEEFQYYKGLYTNVLNPQYPPRAPYSVSPLAATRHLAKDPASVAAAASARDLAFYENLGHSLNRPTGSSNLEKMSQQALLESLRRGDRPHQLMGACLLRSFNYSPTVTGEE